MDGTRIASTPTGAVELVTRLFDPFEDCVVGVSLGVSATKP